MLRSVQIAGFRGFQRFELHRLGQVNLLVGANNSGKTALLEAIEMLVANHPTHVVASMQRRGELLLPGETELDLRRLFHGFKLDEHARFELTGSDDARAQLRVAASIVELTPQQLQQLVHKVWGPLAENVSHTPRLALELAWSERPSLRFPLSPEGGLSLLDVQLRVGLGGSPRTVFVPTSSLSPYEIIAGAEAIQLKPEEQLVLDTLKLIEPRIQAFRTHGLRITGKNSNPGRAGIIVKLDGVDDPVPIGSFGEGVYRLLGLALALARARGGVLLVDEIDTGLHYTVMDKMWRMVKQTAEKLDVQVFATTHSRDCYQSLATIVDPNAEGPSRVTIQRIEVGSERSVAFSEQEIALAAERGLEVR
ncbi:MAG TPA: AAA family ATPase [Nannocystis sp.]